MSRFVGIPFIWETPHDILGFQTMVMQSVVNMPVRYSQSTLIGYDIERKVVVEMEVDNDHIMFGSLELAKENETLNN